MREHGAQGALNLRFTMSWMIQIKYMWQKLVKGVWFTIGISIWCLVRLRVNRFWTDPFAQEVFAQALTYPDIKSPHATVGTPNFETLRNSGRCHPASSENSTNHVLWKLNHHPQDVERYSLTVFGLRVIFLVFQKRMRCELHPYIHEYRHTITYNYIQLPTITYNYIQLHTITYNYIQLHTITYNYIQIHTITYNRIQSHTITYIDVNESIPFKLALIP